MQSNTSGDEPTPNTVGEVLARTRRQLESRLDADLLACLALGCDRSWLYGHDRDPVDAAARARLDRLVEQRRTGRPIAQLCGNREFYGRDFRVDESVLIPRPETELLIELSLSMDLPAEANVCDVGAGSGCIALTLAAERPDWRVTASDISDAALVVAADNRAIHGLEHVELLRGDLLAGQDDHRFDLIISNPPYVAESDPHLEHGDVRFEPRGALAAGTDGLAVIRRLVTQAFEHLSPGGWLMLEHGHDQADAVRGLLEAAGFETVKSFRDLAGIERVTRGRKPG